MPPTTKHLGNAGHVDRPGCRTSDELNMPIKGNDHKQSIGVVQIAQLVSQGRDFFGQTPSYAFSDHNRQTLDFQRLRRFDQAFVQFFLAIG